MLRRFALITVCICLAAGCSKKLPDVAKAVPADADLVASLDAKSTLAYAKQAITKTVPAEHKDKVPGVEMILKKAVEMTGIVGAGSKSILAYLERQKPQEAGEKGVRVLVRFWQAY